MSSETDVKKKRLLKSESAPGVSEPKKTKTEDKAMPASEEEEALHRDPVTDLQSFQASCDFLRSSIKNIKQLKLKANSSAEITAVRTDATIHFIHMKKLNRMSHFRCRKVRETTNEAKHKIDQCHLQLQNLLYEAMHLEKEITKCMEFKSKDEEIQLVPVEEFYKHAPESVSKPEVTKSDDHQQMLARLEWELEQRKQLSDQLTKTKSDKEKMSEEIQSKQDYLDTLQPKLSDVLEATRPVQDYLDMPYDRIREEHEKAQHLPVPLYVLYMQASAYREACDKCLHVSIHGDVDAAKSLTSFTFEPEEDSDSDAEDQDKPESKRRRKNQEARKLEKKNRVLKKHPLCVILDLNKGGDAELQLTFYYCLALNIITVNVKVASEAKLKTTCISGGDLLSPEQILDELYPGDHGNESPNVANHYELKKYGLQEMSTYIPLIGRPYLWCQWMGGLQFLKKEVDKAEKDTGSEEADADAPNVTTVRAKHAVSAANMQRTITLLRERMRARLCLLQQLSSLERGIIPISAELLKLYPAKINAHLSSWKRSTYDDLSQLPQADRFIKAGLVKETDLVFIAVIDRGSAKLTAYIVLTANCPQVAPLFILDIVYHSHRTALNDVHVKEMEEEVNLHYPELLLLPPLVKGESSPSNLAALFAPHVGRREQAMTRARDQLLPGQVQRLLMCLDVYLETDTPASSAVPLEIPKEKMMPRTSRGPSRAKPYKYVPELGIFTHRC
ncbi:tho complex subunit 5-like protein [Plakobranchus ocellatus]|uniref:Tho complex subunit 5-like protein n=1 Tax=Plakobranchus ocellatus TaxID=259542 RepID=A0AAV4ASH6_9GAST|nr:tho complex subunit 5-like protein [Plakobranchus ocellatus]